jgi:hypothetical protein
MMAMIIPVTVALIRAIPIPVEVKAESCFEKISVAKDTHDKTDRMPVMLPAVNMAMNLEGVWSPVTWISPEVLFQHTDIILKPFPQRNINKPFF